MEGLCPPPESGSQPAVFEGYYKWKWRKRFPWMDLPLTLLFTGNHFTDWYIKATSRQENLNIQTGCKPVLYIQGWEIGFCPDHDGFVTPGLKPASRQYLLWHFLEHGKIKSDMVDLSTSGTVRISRSNLPVSIHLLIKITGTIAKDNEVIIDSSAIQFHDLAFWIGQTKLQIDGKISSLPQDTLFLKFNKVDISDLDYFPGKSGCQCRRHPEWQSEADEISLIRLLFCRTLISTVSLSIRNTWVMVNFMVFMNDKAERFRM